jgi:hypothetical protein
VGLFNASPAYTKLRLALTPRFLDAHVATKRECWACLVVILLWYVGAMKLFLEKIPTDSHFCQRAYSGGIRTICMDCQKKGSPEVVKYALIALATNDTPQLPCLGRLDSPTMFPCPEHVFEAYYKLATNGLMNYNSYRAIEAIQLMHDWYNPN